ncbi:DMT family transporter [Lyngbya sp. CCY1209]|jgi:drug/metabolite transporter (DMT)-like permease|uniref:DMT family transporter n=1 Tax=Lyngbya sp. CCY1209 TaxID=2886103 RepID=UPI002D204D87|nr:DMT family transporter [Lyngbya sp. CCY1209]MEB3885016.1 DMT family transporter [Lyngbya sp. CCY1209]
MSLTRALPSLQPDRLRIPQISSTVSALVAIFLAIASLSFAAIFIRLSERELGPFSTILHRFWIAFLVLGVIYALEHWKTGESPEAKPKVEALNRRDLVLLIGAGVMFWGCLAFWAWSLTLTGVANSTILHNLTPLFTTLGAWVIFHESFDRRFLMGLLVATIGAIALGLDDFQVGAEHLNGDIAALLSAVFSAANLMLIETLRHKFPATVILMWCCGVGTILSLPVVLLAEDQLFPVTLSGWMAVIGLAIVCQVVGQGLQAYSLKRLSSGLVGIFLLLDPVFAAIIAWIVFVEGLTLVNTLAFATVLGGIYLAKSSQYSDRILSEEASA